MIPFNTTKALELADEAMGEYRDGYEKAYKNIPDLADMVRTAVNEIEYLAYENETLRAALGWYANTDNWVSYGNHNLDYTPAPIVTDCGHRARRALGD